MADVGAGTGIASELFRRRGYRVTGIEPNAAMRAEALVAGLDCRDGTAEATGLEGASADLVLCAQAFHWVEHERAKEEFLRVVKPDGLIAILWNVRLTAGSAFAEGLEELLLRRSPDYAEKVTIDTQRAVVNVERVFAPREVTLWQARHCQPLDWPALEGRMLSTSYVPLGDAEFVAGLRELFEATAEGCVVQMEYDCQMHWLRP